MAKPIDPNLDALAQLFQAQGGMSSMDDAPAAPAGNDILAQLQLNAAPSPTTGPTGAIAPKKGASRSPASAPKMKPGEAMQVVMETARKGQPASVMDRLMQLQIDGIDSQKQGLSALEAKHAALAEDNAMNPWVAALMGASDIYSGSNQLTGYSERQAKAAEKRMQQEQELQKFREGISGKELDLLKLQAGQENETRKLSQEAEKMKLSYKVGMANANKRGGDGDDDKFTYKQMQALKDDLDPNKARGGNFAKSQAKINSAQAVEGLFAQFPDFNVPPTATTELATAVAGLIGNGSAQSQAQIEHLTPKSLKGNIAGIAGWLTNEPKGLEQQAFMKLLHETAVREREIAKQQILEVQHQRAGAHSMLAERHPDKFNQIISSYELDPEEFQGGQYKPKAKAPASGMVKLAAPDGSINEVPASQVEYYLGKGAKRVQ